MGEVKGITKARMELEDLYSGIPDDSVNLTFQDFAVVQEKKRSTALDTIDENKLKTIPSLDFNRAIQQPSIEQKQQQRRQGNFERSVAYDDERSVMYVEKGGRSRRAGIPHSNICTICSTSIFLFKHRCLVCGRVYCRSCVEMGMGDMSEGRKCIQCLGRRFSQRYIERAGKVGCCFGYAGHVKLAELKWAEKGPRRTGGQSRMMSTSKSPINRRPHHHVHANPPSFISTSSYSPHHHLPL